MADCYLSFGSNVDDRMGNISNAISEIAGFLRIKAISDVYETEPKGFEHQGWFLNLIVRGEFEGDPLELMLLIERIEKKMGRKRKIKDGPRVIDIDILICDSLVINTRKLVLPHPEMTKRMFVLKPLKDVNPAYVHPVDGMSIDELIEKCEDESTVMHLGNFMTKLPEKDKKKSVD